MRLLYGAASLNEILIFNYTIATGPGTACVFQVSGSRVKLACRKDIVLHKTDCTRNWLIYVDCLGDVHASRILFLIRRRCKNRLLAMANHGAAVSGTKTILQQLKVHYRPGLTNVWHACQKWHAAVIALRFFFFFFARTASLYCE
jgi:hypothetical protein